MTRLREITEEDWKALTLEELEEVIINNKLPGGDNIYLCPDWFKAKMWTEKKGK